MNPPQAFRSSAFPYEALKRRKKPGADDIFSTWWRDMPCGLKTQLTQHLQWFWTMPGISMLRCRSNALQPHVTDKVRKQDIFALFVSRRASYSWEFARWFQNQQTFRVGSWLGGGQDQGSHLAPWTETGKDDKNKFCFRKEIQTDILLEECQQYTKFSVRETYHAHMSKWQDRCMRLFLVTLPRIKDRFNSVFAWIKDERLPLQRVCKFNKSILTDHKNAISGWKQCTTIAKRPSRDLSPVFGGDAKNTWHILNFCLFGSCGIPLIGVYTQTKWHLRLAGNLNADQGHDFPNMWIYRNVVDVENIGLCEIFYLCLYSIVQTALQ